MELKDCGLDDALRGRISSYIKRNKWRWSKSYVNIPHEYIVRDSCTLKKREFDEFVMAQREHGIHERWHNYNFPYLYIDGYKYWTMGSPLEETIIINRQKIFSERDCLQDPTVKWYNDTFRDYIFDKLGQIKNERVFEAYCGLGEYIAYSHIGNDRYKGSEPSKKLIAAFRERNAGYYKCVTSSAFEELSDKWRKYGNTILCLFGKASFILRPYLEMVAGGGNDYFLMFFADGVLPEELEGMHTVGYSEGQLTSMFPFAYKCRMDQRYLVVTNMKIKWD